MAHVPYPFVRALRILLVTTVLSVLASASVFAAEFHIFGRVGSSSGLGLDGPSVGVESRIQSGNFVVWTNAVDGRKTTGEKAMFLTGSLEYRHQRGKLLYGGRFTVTRQSTSEWDKTGWHPSARVGYMPNERVAVLFSLNAPDSTPNRTWGLGLSFETLRKRLGLVADIERVLVSSLGGNALCQRHADRTPTWNALLASTRSEEEAREAE